MSRSRNKGRSGQPAGEGTPAGPGPAADEVSPSTPEAAASGLASPELSAVVRAPATVPGPRHPVWMGAKVWLTAYRTELLLFAVAYLVLASFSSFRFLRQSEAPHFIYQAQAWLDGRLDLDPTVLPNLEDWACVREVGGEKVRCAGRSLTTDRWYVSFPAFPALLMMPLVALHGYQFNDTSFGVFLAALGIAFFYSLLRFLLRSGESQREPWENRVLALLLAFGTVFFYCAIRGEVWFLAEVMGVGLTSLYVRNATGARRPLLAGLFFSMATLTRTPLVFAGLYFLIELLAPGPTGRLAQLRASFGREGLEERLRKLGWFVAGAAPLGLAAAGYNFHRFGRLGEFGHAFLFNNRVNADIDRYGLFDLTYLGRNLEAAFLKLPRLVSGPPFITYDPHGLTLLLTLPLIVFLLIPREKRRLHWPLWLTVAICALPGLFYQNTGYMQFGFRFSLDYTPYLILLFALGGWSLKNRWVIAAAALGVLVNVWGAVAFRGYTENVRNW
ncbi:MAG: hypothetical protein M3Y59_02465 [Myxococcota bacterium]|nr:hypothetical protein [Myxococcota bacterium]